MLSDTRKGIAFLKVHGFRPFVFMLWANRDKHGELRGKNQSILEKTCPIALWPLQGNEMHAYFI
jgi:hypothetical protein